MHSPRRWCACWATRNCAQRWRCGAARTRAPGPPLRWPASSRASTPLCTPRRAWLDRRLRLSIYAPVAVEHPEFSATLPAVANRRRWERGMGAKRALIVDDSKSARLFLARVLEKYEIDVDSAESAEAAIDYLSSNRPDVIFMDHLMQGMDGLQAVRAIKNDPRTATIPIMMYTSQEGEVYLGQARALGALGVLPKQIKPADVSKVLYQLHLVPDRRTSEQSSFTPVEMRTPAESGIPAPRVLTESTLREHFAELRRALVAGVDTQTDRITAEVRALLLESLPPPAPLSPVEPPPPPASVPWAWIVACAALAIALASSALWWRSVKVLERLEVEVAQLHAQQAPMIAPGISPQAAAAEASASSSSTSPTAAADEAKPIIVPVPYGA